VTDAELRQDVEAALGEQLHSRRRVERLERRDCEYCASFAVEELDVHLSDGTRLELIHKELGRGSMLEEARAVKPDFLLDARREIEVYRVVLRSAGVDTAPFYGAIERPEASRFGILLGRVAGTHLWQVGEFVAWEQAARWLARLHYGPAGRLAGGCKRLIRYDREFHRVWIERARRFVCESPLRSAADRDAIIGLASGYDRVVEYLANLPRTFIHGDYHASNILCAPQDEGPWRICPIDWEMAAVGPAAIDLAALTAGNWNDEDRGRMVSAYWNAMSAEVRARESLQDLNTSVEYCRLHWAVRWLGWSPHWSPPRTQAQDWLREALLAARRIGL
jgi:Ser/Thr protein kinase RdoA (MazF antagonist)